MSLRRSLLAIGDRQAYGWRRAGPLGAWVRFATGVGVV